ncbi:MAG: C4-type zinc ribbon domain-containing protein [Acidobacteriota bacterium]|nr:C4-type zinc ribbon domain-containing protein [Acidobacteriota bacterium]
MDGEDVDFEKLIQLQELDMCLKQVQTELSDIPGLIAAIEKKIQAGSDHVINAQDLLSKNQKKRRDLEVEVKDLRSQLSRLKHQLNEVKTNKEYTSFLKEIQETQSKIDAFEEEIIKELLAADEIEEEIRAALLKQKDESEHLKQEIGVLNQRRRSLEEQEAVLNKQKNELLPAIPRAQLQQYLSIARKRGGIALSKVIDEFCSMCQMRIRPQMLNEIKDRSKLYLCESCGRILYFEPPAEEPARDEEGSSR